MRRYLALARLANGPRLLAGSLLVAPGQAAIDLVILLALHHATGSFGAGGVAVAAGTIAFSVSTIVQGRLIDRFRIPRVLRPAALALATATAALAAAVALGAAPALLIGLTALVGLSQPATGPAARTAWTTAATDADTRVTAFSYCSVTQDVGFVAGPALFGLLATAATPSISLACCGALITTGALAISSATATPSSAGRVVPARSRNLLRSVAPLATVMVAIGAALGAVDVSAPAFATQHGQPGLAGVLPPVRQPARRARLRGAIVERPSDPPAARLRGRVRGNARAPGARADPRRGRGRPADRRGANGRDAHHRLPTRRRPRSRGPHDRRLLATDTRAQRGGRRGLRGRRHSSPRTDRWRTASCSAPARRYSPRSLPLASPSHRGASGTPVAAVAG